MKIWLVRADSLINESAVTHVVTRLKNDIVLGKTGGSVQCACMYK